MQIRADIPKHMADKPPEGMCDHAPQDAFAHAEKQHLIRRYTPMKRELGIARCGLACCVCGENESCLGCLSDGCKDREWCENRRCALERGVEGCWACPEAECQKGLLQKPRVRAFTAYIRAYGKKRLMDCLERNEAAGVQYHYPGQLVGDYDRFTTQQEIWDAIEAHIV